MFTFERLIITATTIPVPMYKAPWLGNFFAKPKIEFSQIQADGFLNLFQKHHPIKQGKRYAIRGGSGVR